MDKQMIELGEKIIKSKDDLKIMFIGEYRKNFPENFPDTDFNNRLRYLAGIPIRINGKTFKGEAVLSDTLYNIMMDVFSE